MRTGAFLLQVGTALELILATGCAMTGVVIGEAISGSALVIDSSFKSLP